MNSNALSCGETDFYWVKLYPKPAENLESIYCSYLVGRYNAYAAFLNGFSTRENLEGHAIWRNRYCKESALKTLEILQKDYPTYAINCSKYLNFDNLKNERAKENQ